MKGAWLMYEDDLHKGAWLSVGGVATSQGGGASRSINGAGTQPKMEKGAGPKYRGRGFFSMGAWPFEGGVVIP